LLAFCRSLSSWPRICSFGAAGISPTMTLAPPMSAACAKSVSPALFRSPAAPFLSCPCSFLTSSSNPSTRVRTSSGLQLSMPVSPSDEQAGPLHRLHGAAAGDAGDAADAFGHAFLGDELEEAGLAGVVQVRAAAELNGVGNRRFLRRRGADEQHA